MDSVIIAPFAHFFALDGKYCWPAKFRAAEEIVVQFRNVAAVDIGILHCFQAQTGELAELLHAKGIDTAA